MEKAEIRRAPRDSNLELLRIATMLLIIAHHYVVNSHVHTGVLADPYTWRAAFTVVMGGWGKAGINCFVMITGYYMCTSRITARKFAKLLGEFMFYQVIIQAVFWLTGYEPVTLGGVARTLLPFTEIGNNFVGTYLLFYLSIPFLNLLIRAMSERQHLRLLMLLTFIYVVFGTAPRLSVAMNYVSWFATVYLTAAYLRLYPKRGWSRARPWAIAAAAVAALMILSMLALLRLGARMGAFIAYRFVTDSNTLLAYAFGVCAFMAFKHLRLPYSRAINALGASTFGVLCIHAHSNAMRKLLWQDLFDTRAIYPLPAMPLLAIGSVLIVFAACAAIDLLRIRFVEAPFFRFWDRHWDRFSARFHAAEDRAAAKFNIGK